MSTFPEAQATEKSTTAHPGPRHALYRDWVLLLTVGLIIAVDQVSKQIVQANLRLGDSWPAHGVARITHGTNTGSAFGLFQNQTMLLIIASVVAIGFLIYFYRAHAIPRLALRLGIGLILGGAIGNLIDRLRAGTVVDFIDLGPWPIFNLADSSIVVGIAVLIGTLVLTGGRVPSATPSRQDGPGAPNGQ